ncbi:MAG TPA: hypothetical protein VLL76_09085, partial [Candidatus Omnitrophota bacterium]|nr:hypothetical protein [Candidatus Omnitrophota bacterium]
DWRQHVAEQPCYYYEPRAQRGEIADGQKVAIAYAHQVMVPAGVDVTEADRIHGITDRRGASIAGHAFGITRIVRRRDHLLLTLEVAT